MRLSTNGVGKLLRINNAGKVAISTNGTERLRITSTGKIQASAGTHWVGTVSQSGTSAVIEQDSNANGEYVRFADGTLICTGSQRTATTGVIISAGNYLSRTFDTFVSAFSSKPALVVEQSLGSYSPANVHRYFDERNQYSAGNDLTQSRITFINGGASVSMQYKVIAIGRWY